MRRFSIPNVHARIQAATAATVAAWGWENTTVEKICETAEISPETFHEHFPGKQEAALSAVEALADIAMLDCRTAAAVAGSWPEGMLAISGVLTDWGTSEPAFARLALVEIQKGGTQATELIESLIDTFALFLAPGYRLAGEQAIPSRSLDAAVGAEVLAALRGRVARHGPETLNAIVPELTRIVLTPFLGRDATERFLEKRRDG